MEFKKILTVATLATSLVAFSAYSTSYIPKDAKLAAKNKQYYHLDLSTNPPTLDPGLSYDSASDFIIRQIFEALVVQDPVTLKYVPGAAESWTVNEDNTVFTFKLRKNAKWSDGKLVTAHDFVYAWKRIVDPNNASDFASYLDASLNVLNADKILANKASVDSLGVKALDNFTFQVTLNIATPWFIEAIAYTALAPVPKDVVEKYGNKWTQPKHIVSNGAFILTEYVPNEKIILRKNKNYYDVKDVVLEGADLLIIPKEEIAFNRFKAGHTDFVGISSSRYASVVKSGEKIYHQKSQSANGIVYNINNPKVADVRVRKAITYVLDTKLIAEKVITLGAKPTTTWVRPDSTDGHLVENGPWFNWTAAKQEKEALKLLAEAGYTAKKPLELEFIYNTSESWKKMFVAIQNIIHKRLKGVVKVKLVNQEWKVFLTTVNSGHWEVARKGWGLDFDNAINFLSIFRSTDENNRSGFNSKEFDDTYNKFLTAKAEERPYIIKRLEQILTQEEFGLAGVYLSIGNALVNPKLKGLNPQAARQYLKNYYFVK